MPKQLFMEGGFSVMGIPVNVWFWRVGHHEARGGQRVFHSLNGSESWHQQSLLPGKRYWPSWWQILWPYQPSPCTDLYGIIDSQYHIVPVIDTNNDKVGWFHNGNGCQGTEIHQYFPSSVHSSTFFSDWGRANLKQIESASSQDLAIA